MTKSREYQLTKRQFSGTRWSRRKTDGYKTPAIRLSCAGDPKKEVGPLIHRRNEREPSIQYYLGEGWKEQGRRHPEKSGGKGYVSSGRKKNGQKENTKPSTKKGAEKENGETKTLET